MTEESQPDPRKIASSNHYDKLYAALRVCDRILSSKRHDKTKVRLVKLQIKKALDG